jgi:large subunit ribosomal protein L18
MLTTKHLDRREKRHLRIRKKVQGTAARPRLSVYKSSKHIYLQLIDDENARTLASVTSNTKANKASGKKSFSNVESGASLGRQIAEKARAAGHEQIVFDRSGYRYHGIIKAVADAAREAGLKF